MFRPTHLLISRSRQTPVQLVPTAQSCKIITEQDWQRNSEPAFELRPRQGFFCQGIPVVGYQLQPIDLDAAAAITDATAADQPTSAQ